MTLIPYAAKPLIVGSTGVLSPCASSSSDMFAMRSPNRNVGQEKLGMSIRTGVYSVPRTSETGYIEPVSLTATFYSDLESGTYGWAAKRVDILGCHRMPHMLPSIL